MIVLFDFFTHAMRHVKDDAFSGGNADKQFFGAPCKTLPFHDIIGERGGRVYSDVFCKVYNEFGWNYYPEAFGEQLLKWMEEKGFRPKTSLDLACGTGILCEILHNRGIQACGMDLSSGMIDIARASEPAIGYDVADMVTYRPDRTFDLVTCTGDALNHILDLQAVGQIFENIYGYLAPGGWLVFDLLNENEVSTSEPFEMDFDDHIRVWFQMTRPGENTVNLQIRVFKDGVLQFAENITETIHDPAVICGLLQKAGLREIRCADRLLEDGGHGTTWFITAQKPMTD